jgi:hypothetical protein
MLKYEYNIIGTYLQTHFEIFMTKQLIFSIRILSIDIQPLEYSKLEPKNHYFVII